MGVNTITRKRGERHGFTQWTGGKAIDTALGIMNAVTHPFDTIKSFTSSIKKEINENDEVPVMFYTGVRVSTVESRNVLMYKIIKKDETLKDYICKEIKGDSIEFCKFLETDCITVKNTEFYNYKIFKYKQSIEDIEELLNTPEKRDGWSRWSRTRVSIDPYEVIFKNEDYKRFMNESFLNKFSQNQTKIIKKKYPDISEERLKQKIDRNLNYVRKFVYNTNSFDAFKDINILKLLYIFKYQYMKSMGLRFDYMEVLFWIMKKMILDVGSNQKKYEEAFGFNMTIIVSQLTFTKSVTKIIITILQKLFKSGNYITKDVSFVNEELLNDIKEGTVSVGGNLKGVNIPYIPITNIIGITLRKFPEIEEEFNNEMIVTYNTKDPLEKFTFHPIHQLNKYFYFNECIDLFEEEIMFCFAKSFIDYFKMLISKNKYTYIIGSEELYISRTLKDILKLFYGNNLYINTFVQELIKTPQLFVDETKTNIENEKNTQEKIEQIKKTQEFVSSKINQIVKVNINNNYLDTVIQNVITDRITFPKDILKRATGTNKQLRYPDQELIKMFIEIVTNFLNKNRDKYKNKRVSLIMMHDFVYVTDFITENIKNMSNLTIMNDDERRDNIEKSINIMYAYNIIRIVRKAITTNGKRDEKKVNEVIQLMGIISRQFCTGMHSIVFELQNFPVAVLGFFTSFIASYLGPWAAALLATPFAPIGFIIYILYFLGSLPASGGWFFFSVREVYGAFFIHLFLVYNIWTLNDKAGILENENKKIGDQPTVVNEKTIKNEIEAIKRG